jgi:hypothetical protein
MFQSIASCVESRGPSIVVSYVVSTMSCKISTTLLCNDVGSCVIEMRF